MNGRPAMQSDIVEELEAWSDSDGEYGHHAQSQCLAKAATEITALRDRVARLEGELASIRDQEEYEIALDPDWPRRVARAALNDSPPATDGV